MVFGNGVKNIQAAAYNGARTVYYMLKKTGCHYWKMFNHLKTLDVWANQELMDLVL